MSTPKELRRITHLNFGKPTKYYGLTDKEMLLLIAYAGTYRIPGYETDDFSACHLANEEHEFIYMDDEQIINLDNEEAILDKVGIREYALNKLEKKCNFPLDKFLKVDSFYDFETLLNKLDMPGRDVVLIIEDWYKNHADAIFINDEEDTIADVVSYSLWPCDDNVYTNYENELMAFEEKYMKLDQ